MLECTPKLLPFIQQSQTGTLNLNRAGYGSNLVHEQCGIGVFSLLPDLFLPLLRPLPTPCPAFSKNGPHHHLIIRALTQLSPFFPCLLPQTGQTLLRTHTTTCAYLHIVPRTWADITHTPALVPLLVKS